ncbi:hypothetical protein [Rhodohalobacter sp.]|uniref:hypothetical protein n=1 Tax=Rhodohalobacter sp. TaxID=1974210 RepID=UPI002ACDA4BE|nr:hypothetical protein [Rhodohalobacter sp.]MDZ7757041.1 hypothetical protein [Rhodohalobacter sp.]
MKRYLRRGVILFIVGIILYQLFDIGWREVLNSLPTHPLFYIIFAFLYISLPIAEVFIYGQVWKIGKLESFKGFITKKVYNDEVMGYSGEFYLFVWGRKYLDKKDKEILKDIRDNNILSALTSNLVAFSLVGILVYTGTINLEEMIDDVNTVYVILGIVITTVFTVLAVQFRKYLFSLPLEKSIKIFGIYLFRFLIHHGLLIVQWAVVIPNTPITIWFTFLAIVIVVNRIPFLPSRDLVFMWAGIELSKMLNMATASVAGMLLVTSVLRKVTNLILFLWISYSDKNKEIRRLQMEASQQTDFENL